MKKMKFLMTHSHVEAHDRGVKYTLKKLMDAGMEVVYIKFKLVEEIYSVATQEDVDMIGISCSSTNAVRIVTDLMEVFSEQQADFPIIVGGVVPAGDIQKVKEMGVKAIFGPGSDPNDIVACVRETIAARES